MSAVIDSVPKHNLAESFAGALGIGEVTDEELRDLRLDYGTSAGAERLRTLVANLEGGRADDILITTGSAMGIFLLACLYAEPGREVVVHRPSFPPVVDVVTGFGARLVEVRSAFADRYRLDPDRIIDALSPQTSMVVLATPQNPAGVEVPRSVVLEIAEAMQQRCVEAVLLVDEVYRNSTGRGQEPVPSLAGAAPGLITCGGLSKAEGAPGLRIGWLSVADAEVREQLRRAKFGASVSCGALDEQLAIRVLERHEAIMGPRRDALSVGRDALSRWVADSAQWVEWVAPDAGAMACVRLRPEVFDDDAVERFYAGLQAAGVLVAPGPWFGDESRVFRVGFAHQPVPELSVALDVVGEVLAASIG